MRREGSLLRELVREKSLHPLEAVAVIVSSPEIVRIFHVVLVDSRLEFCFNLLGSQVELLELS